VALFWMIQSPCLPTAQLAEPRHLQPASKLIFAMNSAGTRWDDLTSVLSIARADFLTLGRKARSVAELYPHSSMALACSPLTCTCSVGHLFFQVWRLLVLSRFYQRYPTQSSAWARGWGRQLNQGFQWSLQEPRRDQAPALAEERSLALHSPSE